MKQTTIILVALAFLHGCLASNAPIKQTTLQLNDQNQSTSTGRWYQPSVAVSWHWQLSGKVNTSHEADLYDIDLFDSSSALIRQLHASGRKVICYFSAGSYENWREDKAKFRKGEIGNKLDEWEDERWLDIRSGNVHAIMKERLDLAIRKGCDGVEPDNVDGYANHTGFDLTAEDQLAYNRFLAEEAHLRHLSVGLKNDLDQIPALVDAFDFAVNEQCFEYNECASLSPFIEQGKPVLHVEYSREHLNNKAKATLCNTLKNMQFSTLILPTGLDDTFRFSCP